MAALTEAVTQSRRRFYNYIEAKHDGTAIRDVKPENGAALVAKYNGMHFFDDDTDGSMGAYFRIRSGTFSWLGKRQGGWAATCDEMPSGGPSEDPVRDIEPTDEYKPERYVINKSLHSMTARALQAPGVVHVDEDSDEGDRRQRRGLKEEGGQGVEGGGAADEGSVQEGRRCGVCVV